MEQKEYTKYELGNLLNVSVEKTSNITRKLDSLKIKYITCGRGEDYRIHILEIPKPGIKEFAQQYLGITINKATAAAFEHYLYMITLAIDAGVYSNMCASSLQWQVDACDDTIDKWIDKCVECGLLKENTSIGAFYKTRKRVINNYEDDTYDYTRIYEEVSKEEYEEKNQVYYKDLYSLTKDLETNIYIANQEEAVYRATMASLNKNEYWCYRHKEKHYQTEINKAWPHYEELIGLLKDYKFVPFVKVKKRRSRKRARGANEKRRRMGNFTREEKKKN